MKSTGQNSRSTKLRYRLVGTLNTQQLKAHLKLCEADIRLADIEIRRRFNVPDTNYYSISLSNGKVLLDLVRRRTPLQREKISKSNLSS